LRDESGSSSDERTDGRDERTDELRQWIAAAQAGSEEALGKLLQACRGYLLQIANAELDSALRAKLGASDVVQETLLEAKQGINDFCGATRAEFLGWVRRILKNNLRDARRHLQAEKRRVSREHRLDGEGRAAVDAMADKTETPSALVSEREDELRLARAMDALTADHRLVIELRNWQLLSFAEIGERLERSEEAARKLWVRAIDRLRLEMQVSDDH